MISPETAKKYGITDGLDVVVETNRGQVRMKARLDDKVAEGVVFVPHGWPREANANLLTDVQGKGCILGYPDIKSLMCSIRTA